MLIQHYDLDDYFSMFHDDLLVIISSRSSTVGVRARVVTMVRRCIYMVPFYP